MVAEGKLYGTTEIMPDALEVQLAFASNVSAFSSEHQHLIPTDANLAFQWRDVEKALEGKATSGSRQFTRPFLITSTVRVAFSMKDGATRLCIFWGFRCP